MLYMRRVLVIFLIFLFPLNVLALSMSVSSMQPAGIPQATAASAATPAIVHAHAHADVDTGTAAADHAAGTPASQSACDIDPDEPPAGTDFHDWVTRAACAHLAILPEEQISSLVPARRGLSAFPPLKPPPLA